MGGRAIRATPAPRPGPRSTSSRRRSPRRASRWPTWSGPGCSSPIAGARRPPSLAVHGERFGDDPAGVDHRRGRRAHRAVAARRDRGGGPTRLTMLRAMLDPAILPAYLTSAARIARRGLRGPHRFAGDARAIARACVDASWDGDHFNASGGHFRQFWTRDTGFSAAGARPDRGRSEAARVPRLGDGRLGWPRPGHDDDLPGSPAARRLHARGSTRCHCCSTPCERAARATSSAATVPGWSARPARYVEAVVDPRTGLVRTDRRFSSHRDTVVTRFERLRQHDAGAARPGPARDRLVARRPCPNGVDRAVRGERSGDGDRVGDRPDSARRRAATRPSSRSGSASCPPISAWRRRSRPPAAEGLTRPLPLRYVARRERSLEDPVQRLFVPDYQGTAIWTSLGAIYLQLLRPDRPPGGRRGSGRSCDRHRARRHGLGGPRLTTCGRMSGASGSSGPTRRCCGARSCSTCSNGTALRSLRPSRGSGRRPPGSRRPPGRGTGSAATTSGRPTRRPPATRCRRGRPADRRRHDHHGHGGERREDRRPDELEVVERPARQPLDARREQRRAPATGRSPRPSGPRAG